MAIAALESESDTNLKSLRTDEGGEYVSVAWTNYVQTKKMSSELTTPYIPLQNGIAEQLNMAFVGKMRCLMIWSEPSKSYWGVPLLHSN